MGYKSVCLDCRIAFSQGTDFTKFKYDKVCPNCGKTMAFLSEKFKPPQKKEDKKWEVVKFFVENGFDYSTKIGGDFYISYNETLEEAREVVRKYQEMKRRDSMRTDSKK